MDRVKDLLDITYPVIQGPLDNISGPDLVAKVSEAGGLGVLETASTPSKDILEERIEKTRDKTSRPFGVNVPLYRKRDPESWIRTVLENDVEVLSISGGSPKPYMDLIEGARIKMQVIPHVKQAEKMERLGFDLLVVEGGESGGAISPKWDSTLCLTSEVVDVVDIPVVAAGGIADVKTASAVKKLGAEGVQMGTRFIASEESKVHRDVKEEIVESSCDNVFSLKVGQALINVLENGYLSELESEEMDLQTLKTLSQKAWQGNVDEGLIIAGQSVGRISEIKKVAEIVESIGSVFTR